MASGTRPSEPRPHVHHITFATNVLLNGALLSALVLLRDRGVGILHWARLDPIVAGIVGGVALDFSFYVAHVAMHKVPAFWNVHRVHHSDPVVDVTTTIRQHPAEGLIRYAFMATFRVRIGSGARRRRVSPGGSSRRGARRAANVRALPRRMKRFATSP